MSELLEGIRLDGPWPTSTTTEEQRHQVWLALGSLGLDVIDLPLTLDAWVVVFEADAPIANQLRLASAVLRRRQLRINQQGDA